MVGGKRLVESRNWTAMTERELVLSARSGNKEAFGELVRRHRSQVYGWANKMTGTPILLMISCRMLSSTHICRWAACSMRGGLGHDAREYAVAFLSRLRDSWGTPWSMRDRGIRMLAGEAAAHYAETAKALRKLRVLFPDPYGGEPNRTRQARTAIWLIQYAKSQEENAIRCLRDIVAMLQS